MSTINKEFNNNDIFNLKPFEKQRPMILVKSLKNLKNQVPNIDNSVVDIKKIINFSLG